jgi:hypothetical protein
MEVSEQKFGIRNRGRYLGVDPYRYSIKSLGPDKDSAIQSFSIQFSESVTF